MIKKNFIMAGLMLLLCTLTGCSEVGNKSATMSGIYLVTSMLALILLAGYCFLIKKKEFWFMVLFSAVVVINVGYLSLSVSGTLDEALLANRIAYLGSVFLPLSMLILILKSCKMNLKKWMVCTLIGMSVLIFLIAASPGYLDVYYKEVSLIKVNGVAVLQKEYGPLHSLYLYYLLGYFGAMVAVILYARISRRVKSSLHAVFLAISVFVNIGVWLMEQLVKIDFEILSVSYIVSELFLLGISLLLQDTKVENLIYTKSQAENSLENSVTTDSVPADTVSGAQQSADQLQDKCEYLVSKIYTLTPAEKEIFELYISGKQIKEVKVMLDITENTLKYHNRNIYSKLGVSSRKELIEVSKAANVSI